MRKKTYTTRRGRTSARLSIDAPPPKKKRFTTSFSAEGCNSNRKTSVVPVCCDIAWSSSSLHTFPLSWLWLPAILLSYCFISVSFWQHKPAARHITASLTPVCCCDLQKIVLVDFLVNDHCQYIQDPLLLRIVNTYRV